MSDDLKLRQTPKPTVQVNKMVLLIVAVLLTVFLGWVVITALQVSHHHAHKTALEVKPQQQAIVKSIAALPDDYTQASSAPKYTAGLSSVEAQQSKMSQEIQRLKQQLQGHHSNSSDRQAATSVMYFPGTQPDNKMTSPIINTFPGTAPDKKTLTGDTAPAGKDAYVAQNMQLQKLDFLHDETKDQKVIYNTHRLEKPMSKDELQAGTLMPALLVTSINTALPGQIVAQVTDDLFDSVTGHTLLVPKGSRLIGQYDSQVAYGQSRVLIVFKRIIMPNGNSILLSNAQGADLFGQSGVQANVNNHWGRVMGAAVLSSVLSLGTGLTADNTFSNDNNFYRGTGQTALLGAANNVSQVGQQLTGRAMNIQPTLVIPAGYAFNIIVNKDMVLVPYEQK